MLRLTNKSKYVNMTDIITDAPRRKDPSSPASTDDGPGAAAQPGHDELYWYIEALFFAYRDFTSDPDRILNEKGFGRAHHRVLHFIHRYPGMRVADLLEILQITKQSLARVLRELIKNSYVEQQPGKADKRERLLYVTREGAVLAGRLAAPQLKRIEHALAAVGHDGHPAVARFLQAMMSEVTSRQSGPEEAATEPARSQTGGRK